MNKEDLKELKEARAVCNIVRYNENNDNAIDPKMYMSILYMFGLVNALFPEFQDDLRKAEKEMLAELEALKAKIKKALEEEGEDAHVCEIETSIDFIYDAFGDFSDEEYHIPTDGRVDFNITEHFCLQCYYDALCTIYADKCLPEAEESLDFMIDYCYNSIESYVDQLRCIYESDIIELAIENGKQSIRKFVRENCGE